MAFVYRSKKTDIQPRLITTTDLGPGSYINHSYYDIKERIIPFNTTTKKQEIIKNDVKKTPGPGSYFKNYEKILKTEYDSLINSNINRQQQPIYKVLDYDELAKNSQYSELFKEKVKPTGFLNREIRFNSLNKDEIQTPGPGFYIGNDIKDKKTSLKKKKTSFNKENKELKEVEYKTTTSIPSKMESYGYKVIGGELIRNTQVKNESQVSPFSYDINNHTKSTWNNKTLTSIWSRSRTTRDVFLVKEQKNKKIDEKDDLSSSILKSNLNLTQNLNVNNSKTKIINKILLSNKERRKEFNRPKSSDVNNTISNSKINEILTSAILETPGPGYYYNESSASNYIKTLPESFQCFGSRSSRFNNLVNTFSIDELPGPGSYFNSKEKEFIDKKNKNIKEIYKNHMSKTFNNKANKNKTYLSSNNSNNNNKLPGPGQYDPIFEPKIRKNKILSHVKGIFGSCETRFPNKTKSTEDLNGPGSYLPVYNYDELYNKDKDKDKDINSKGRRRYMNKILSTDKDEKNDESIVLLENNKKKNEIPSVGTYNPDYYYNIENKLRNNINKVSSVFAPFNSLQRRFEKVKKDKYKYNIGPGYYYKEKPAVYKQSPAPFNISNRKLDEFNTNSNSSMNSNMNSKVKVGPGNYNIDSYFDWVKKSFNVNFV